MKAIIVDDEPLARKRIRSLLNKYVEIEVVKECANGKSAILAINSLAPELVFLDINMKDMTGFQVLEEIQLKPKPIIIFVTAYDQHALQAFDFEAFDFLLKPFKEERFYSTVERILKLPQREINLLFEKRFQEFMERSTSLTERKESIPSHLAIRHGNTSVLLRPSEILYILASGYYAEIYTKRKKHVIRESLSNLEQMLAAGDFFRVHRSAIVNLAYVEEIVHSDYSEIDVKMNDNKLISISKSQKKSFLKRLGLNSN